MRIKDTKIFRDNQCSMQETSKDTSKKPVQYMTNSILKVINFDNVKTQYMNQNGMSEELAHSVDALYQREYDKNIVMIEFKNGAVDNRNIEMKARDSLLIFNDITDKQLEFDRKYIDFILVYNEDAINLNFRDKKALALANKGKQEYTLFGLAKLRGFCFKEVHAYSKAQFEKWMEE